MILKHHQAEETGRAIKHDNDTCLEWPVYANPNNIYATY